MVEADSVGVVKSAPVYKAVPLNGVEYHVMLPLVAVAERVRVPDPHLEAGITDVICEYACDPKKAEDAKTTSIHENSRRLEPGNRGVNFFVFIFLILFFLFRSVDDDFQ